MKRYLVVTINEHPTEAPIAVADALANAGINCDVSVARTIKPTARAASFHVAFEVRPPQPTPTGFTVTRKDATV